MLNIEGGVGWMRTIYLLQFVHLLSQIFQEIGAVQSLKRIVMYSSNATTLSLAKRALRTMGEDVPCHILSSVPNWKTVEVQTWLQQIGFSAFSDRFQVCELQLHLLYIMVLTYDQILADPTVLYQQCHFNSDVVSTMLVLVAGF